MKKVFEFAAFAVAGGIGVAVGILGGDKINEGIDKIVDKLFSKKKGEVADTAETTAE